MSVKPRSMDCSVHAPKELKIWKIIYLGFEKSQRSVTHDSLRYINILTYLLTYLKKVRDVATSPLPPPYISKVACLNFGMLGRVLDIINHAKF